MLYLVTNKEIDSIKTAEIWLVTSGVLREQKRFIDHKTKVFVQLSN